MFAYERKATVWEAFITRILSAERGREASPCKRASAERQPHFLYSSSWSPRRFETTQEIRLALTANGEFGVCLFSVEPFAGLQWEDDLMLAELKANETDSGRRDNYGSVVCATDWRHFLNNVVCKSCCSNKWGCPGSESQQMVFAFACVPHNRGDLYGCSVFCLGKNTLNDFANLKSEALKM